MIIFNRPTTRKAARTKRKRRGKKWWQSRTRIFLVIFIFLLCGAVIGGGSALRKSIKRGKLQKSIQKNITQIKRRLTERSRHIKSLFVPLPANLYVDIKFKEYKKIEEKRQAALSRGYLLSDADDFVNANLRIGGETIPVRLRLKGDLPEHWEGEKWSFRIHTRRDARYKGMRRFSIQHPKARNYIYEWAFFENLRLEGILAPRYDFINVIINGKAKGIYALEENFSKELLESQDRREGVIVRFSEDAHWRQKNNWLHNPYGPNMSAPNSPAFFILQPRNWINCELDVFQGGKVAGSEILSAQRDAAVGLLESFRKRRIKASEIFDGPMLAKFLAVINLWSAEHAIQWTNIRFYYNPVTSKLEPIGFDAQPGRNRRGQFDERLVNAQPSEIFPWGDIDWIYYVLSDPEIARIYVKECMRVSNPEYLDWLKEKLEKDLKAKLLILWREHQDILDWNILARNQEFTMHVLNPIEHLIAYVNPKLNKDGASGRYLLKLDIGNVLTLPIEIMGVRINNGEMIGMVNGNGSAGSVILGSLNPFTNLQTEAFYVSISKEFVSEGVISPDINIKVVSRILGSLDNHEIDAVFMPEPHFIEGLPSALAVNEILKRCPFISYVKESNEFYVDQGVWIVRGDIVLPENTRLIIKEGTILKFDSGVVLIANGPVILEGSDENPIKLCARENSWGGLVVLNAKETSQIENVVIQDVNAVERGGWILTGGVTFYQSPVVFNNVKIQATYSEDALNIVRSKFRITNSMFLDCASDAIDFDFSIGTIDKTLFKNIKGDAIDTSGTQLDISKVNITFAGDKAISIGEKSKVSINDVAIEDTNIAFASKDYSEVSINNAIIKRCNIGLAAYQKKPEFGSASINANNISFEDVAKEVLLQNGSRIKVNGTDYQGQELDVEKLYQKDYQNLILK